MDTLRINSTRLNAMDCTLDDTPTQSFQIPNERPFTISNSNKFVAVGRDAFGVFGLNDSAFSGCAAVCVDKNWAIGNESCSTVRRAKSSQYVKNANCFDTRQGTGNVCKCSNGYEGDGCRNGTGCKYINECTDPSLNNCHSPHGRCENLNGSYKCSCTKGHGDGTKNGTGCHLRHFSQIEYALTGRSKYDTDCCVGHGFVPLLHFEEKKREGSSGAQRTRIFSAEKLQKETNNFAQNLILGSSGYGTVYKGTLADDIVVAIKKSKEID
eukprot:Gb_19086 [translate_table: standard]